MTNLWVLDISHNSILKSNEPVSHPIWNSFNLFYFTWVGFQDRKLEGKHKIPENKDNQERLKLNNYFSNKFGLKPIIFIYLDEM